MVASIGHQFRSVKPTRGNSTSSQVVASLRRACAGSRRDRGRIADIGSRCVGRSMIALPTHGRVYLACGSTDMRRGFDGLAVIVQEVLMQDPHSGALFAFRGDVSSDARCST